MARVADRWSRGDQLLTMWPLGRHHWRRNMSSLRKREHRNIGRLALMAAGIVAIAATTASADTRIMPTRQALKGVNVVVWGNTTQANGTAYTLDCGNGAVTSSNVADRSYIQVTCNYAI